MSKTVNKLEMAVKDKVNQATAEQGIKLANGKRTPSPNVSFSRTSGI
jgi:hypothetical protein